MRFFPGLAAAGLLTMAAGIATAGIVTRSTNAAVEVSVVKRVDVPYHLVTRQQPLDFEVMPDSGHRWLRVYSRLWWPAGGGKPRSYSVSLWQGESEMPYRFETGVSKSSLGSGRHRVGEWRSFFVELPAAPTRYRLALGEASADTVAVRLTYGAPRPWQRVELTGLQAVSVEKAGTGAAAAYVLDPGAGVSLTVAGPGRLRVRVRLSYDAAMAGEQSLLLTVTEKDSTLARRSLRVGKDPVATCAELPQAVLSTQRQVRLAVGAGEHRLSLKVTGTVAKAALVAVDLLPNEAYEE